MKLIELLHSIDKENKAGLVNVDDWRWPDVEHLISMGFDFVDDYRFRTNREPEIIVYRKKEEEENEDGEKTDFFYVEEKGKKTRRFKTFNDVIDYFDTYSQPELDKNK
jgi:hypothetical protein